MIQNLLPKSNEIQELSIMFNESMRGFGVASQILIPTNVEEPELGFQQDVDYNEEDWFDAYIFIDPAPKPKLLLQLGWNIEDDDTKPMLCYISRNIQKLDAPRTVNTCSKEILPTKYTRIKLRYDYDIERYSEKEFIVTKVSSNSFNPVYYVMMIVPYRPTVTPELSPLQDENVRQLNMEETDNNFRFLNKERSEQVSVKY